MAVLFGRSWRLQVDGLDLTDLDLSFKIERATVRAPSVAEIKVYNLSQSTRAQIEQGSTVVLHAGYGDDPALLFRGDLRRVWTELDGQVDRITILQGRDGGRAYSEARISRSYNPGTPVIQVVRDVIAALEIGTGNLDEFSAAYALRNGSDTFAHGYIAHGRGSRILNDLLRGAGLRWSVQGNALQVQRGGQPLQTTAVLLTSSSGLLESPSWDDRGHTTNGRRGVVTAKALIQPGLEPGRRVRLESALITGDFEVRKAVYSGETFGNAWEVTCELRPLATS